MLKTLLLGLRLIKLVLSGCEQVALENVALRQQLGIFKRNLPRPKLLRRDRLFWIVLSRICTEWKSALMVVQPDTVVSWQRQRFKRYWWKLSQPKGPGRPQVRAEIRTLIRNMTPRIRSGARLGYMGDF